MAYPGAGAPANADPLYGFFAAVAGQVSSVHFRDVEVVSHTSTLLNMLEIPKGIALLNLAGQSLGLSNTSI